MKIYEKPEVEYVEFAMQENITFDGSTGLGDNTYFPNGVTYNNG